MATLSDLLSQVAFSPPARPYTPTPLPSDLMDALYGNPTPPQPLPSYLPQNVQNYIRTQPSYTEGQAQGRWPDTGEPGGQSPNPQVGDLQRLFRNRIQQNAPSGTPLSGPFLKNVIQGGYLAGGVDI